MVVTLIRQLRTMELAAAVEWEQPESMELHQLVAQVVTDFQLIHLGAWQHQPDRMSLGLCITPAVAAVESTLHRAALELADTAAVEQLCQVDLHQITEQRTQAAAVEQSAILALVDLVDLESS
jgi:transcriptional regulatory protein LevR